MALIGNSNKEKIWNYFKSKGFTNYGIAALMGNLYAESALNPKNLQNTCSKRLGLSDEEYTKYVDNGKYTNFVKDSSGYGLAQWTYWTRKQNLLNFAKSKNKSIGDLEMQLDFLYKELSESYKSVFNALKSATSLLDASNVVLTKFEKPANQSDSVKKKRAEYGQVYYDEFANKSNSVNKGGSSMSKTKAINALIKVAKNENGYLEKKSNSNLDSKTGNAGSNNYTKYWRDIKNWGLGNLQGSYWCAAFVFWCFVKTFGLATAKKLLYHAPFVYCPTIANLFKQKGRLYSNPKVGDIVVFMTSRFSHTGIVYKVTTTHFYTIEGNTSGASGVVRNGGGVTLKVYSIASAKKSGHKFCRPDYSIVKSINTTVASSSTSDAKNTYNKTVKWNGVVTADALNVRTYAGSENPLCSFSPIKNGKTVGVCDTEKAEDGSTWYYVKYNNRYGFVHSDYVKKKTTTKVVKYKTTSNLNLRSEAVINKKNVLCVIPKGKTVVYKNKYKTVDSVKWYYVTYDNKTGYVSSKYLSKV